MPGHARMVLSKRLYFFLQNPVCQRHVHEAAANGHLDIVRLFHRLGADIESRDDEDRRPLALAAQVTDFCMGEQAG